MFDVKQFRVEIVQKALIELKAYSKEAEELLILTCAQESLGGTYIKQIDGPALGIFQMEPKTHEDLWLSFLPRRTDLVYKILGAVRLQTKPPVEFLEYNLLYAAMMCHVRYMTIHEPIPAATDILGLAKYWDAYYNSDSQKGFPEEAVVSYNKFMGIRKSK